MKCSSYTYFLQYLLINNKDHLQSNVTTQWYNGNRTEGNCKHIFFMYSTSNILMSENSCPS